MMSRIFQKNHCLFYASTLTASSLCSVALGHAGPRIFLDIQNEQVVTYDGPYPPPETTSGAVSTNPADYANYSISQVFPGLPPNETEQNGQPTAGVLPLTWDDDPLNFSTEFPGYQVYAPGSVTAGTSFSYNIMGEVQWYNTSSGSFEAISKAFPTNTPLIAVNNDAGLYAFSSTGFVAGSVAFTYNGDPTDHEHLTYTICTPDDLADGFSPEDAPAGVYALPLQLTSSAATIPSKTFWLLFGDTGADQNISQTSMESEMIQAIVSANSTFVGGSTNVVFWSANTSGSWNTAGNWQGGAVPATAGQVVAFGDTIGTGSATVTLNCPQIAGGIRFYGSEGGSYNIAGSALTLNNGAASPATISVNTGTQTIDAPITITGGLNISTDTGNLVLGGDITGSGVLTVLGSAKVTVASTGVIGVPLAVNGAVTFANASGGSIPLVRSVPSLNISSGGTVVLQEGATASRQLLSIGSAGLSIGTTGLLDLSNNDLLLQAGGSAGLSQISSLIEQGYDGGSWQSSAGITSSAAAENTSYLTALGVILNEYANKPIYTTFDGASTSYGDVLVKYTYYGDANLDGVVDGSDYSLTDNGYLNHLTGWGNGDFNYDGVVDGSDYTLIDNAYNTQGAAFTEAIVTTAIATEQISPPAVNTSVPEPASLCSAAISSLILIARRKRRTVGRETY